MDGTLQEGNGHEMRTIAHDIPEIAEMVKRLANADYISVSDFAMEAAEVADFFLQKARRSEGQLGEIAKVPMFCTFFLIEDAWAQAYMWRELLIQLHMPANLVYQVGYNN
jgi:hypothetical protein